MIGDIPTRKVGRPLGSKNVPKPSKRRSILPEKEKIKSTCTKCGGFYVIDNFYKSNNKMHSLGVSPYCKECTAENCIDKNGYVDDQKLERLCMELDIPYSADVLTAARQEYMNKYKVDSEDKTEKRVVRIYFRLISNPKYRMTFEQFQRKENLALRQEDKVSSLTSGDNFADIRKDRFSDEEPIYLDKDDDDFELTAAIVRQFGEGYTRSIYKLMHEKYKYLSLAYGDQSNLHSEALTGYVRLQVLAELAFSRGDYDEAERLSNLATKQAEKARITPSQLTKADLQGGANSFSEIFMKIEQAEDVLEILPEIRNDPRDVPDFIIWQTVSYLCDTMGKPIPTYADVYKFYDERVIEYLKANPDKEKLFKYNPSTHMREKVEDFITMPTDFIGNIDDGKQE